MNYSKLQSNIVQQFILGKSLTNISADTAIDYYLFQSDIIPTKLNTFDGNSILTDNISENSQFYYPVIKPKSKLRYNKAILLLHGLNERNWQKYISWAIYLSENLQRPIILFPMAYHINRSPESWSNPRVLSEIYKIRKKEHGNDRSISYANIALSDRLSKNPERFYNSGKQSLDDIQKLMQQIKSGKHQLFTENTDVNVLSYSIGAFLAEITFMTDSKKHFSDSKLFMFCGGGLFSSMDGESRQIMDKFSFESICNFYQNNFGSNSESLVDDPIKMAFLSLISSEKFELLRNSFFEFNQNRIKGLFLEKDKVMPYFGVEQLMNKELANKRIALSDFEYDYTHENPFPVFETKTMSVVDTAFEKTFSTISEFLD